MTATVLSDDSFASGRSSGSSMSIDLQRTVDSPSSLTSKSCDDDDDSTTPTDVCCSCKKPIKERHLLKVHGFHRPWHVRCLRCSVCQVPLDTETSCFYRGRSIYCRTDYLGHRSRAFKCSKCQRVLGPTDWVRKARDHMYHLACFACDACKRQLSTGEEFALHEDKLLCKTHYVETATGSSENDGEEGSGHKQKTKRVRTSFTEDQLRILHANFRVDSNPDGQDLERIAQQTGLSKRVTQVWFQNSRARQKKHQQTTTAQHNRNNNNNNNSLSSPPPPLQPPAVSSILSQHPAAATAAVLSAAATYMNLNLRNSLAQLQQSTPLENANIDDPNSCEVDDKSRLFHSADMSLLAALGAGYHHHYTIQHQHHPQQQQQHQQQQHQHLVDPLSARIMDVCSRNKQLEEDADLRGLIFKDDRLCSAGREDIVNGSPDSCIDAGFADYYSQTDAEMSD